MRLFPILLCSGLTIGSLAQTKTTEEPVPFPSKSEIVLLLDQSERAFSSWKQSVELERTVGDDPQLAKQHKDSVNAASQIIAKLRENPDWFNNSALGLSLLVSLDDAARDTAICVAKATASVFKSTQKVGSDRSSLAQGCSRDSELLYTVSENASVLLNNSLIARQQLMQDMDHGIDVCNNVLKKLKKSK